MRNFHNRMLRREIREGTFAYLIITPALLLILGLVLYPIGYAIYMTFFKTDLLKAGNEFLGLQQYVAVLTDRAFWSSLGITVYFTVLSLIVQTILGIAIALLLNLKFKGRGIMRGLVLAPWAVPTVVNAQLWGWIYQASYGALNKILLKIGLISAPVVWLGTANRAMNMIILADTWRMTPLYVVMFLAGLQTISPDLREAALIDGAGSFKRLRYIILPLLQPMMLVVLILRTMQALRVFDIVYLLTQGGPNSGTMVISYYAYFKTFKALDFGYGSTIGLIVAILTIMICLLYKRVLQHEDSY